MTSRLYLPSVIHKNESLVGPASGRMIKNGAKWLKKHPKIKKCREQN